VKRRIDYSVATEFVERECVRTASGSDRILLPHKQTNDAIVFTQTIS